MQQIEAAVRHDNARPAFSGSIHPGHQFILAAETGQHSGPVRRMKRPLESGSVRTRRDKLADHQARQNVRKARGIGQGGTASALEKGNPFSASGHRNGLEIKLVSQAGRAQGDLVLIVARSDDGRKLAEVGGNDRGDAVPIGNRLPLDR